jgi:hypothetical protein
MFNSSVIGAFDVVHTDVCCEKKSIYPVGL